MPYITLKTTKIATKKNWSTNDVYLQRRVSQQFKIKSMISEIMFMSKKKIWLHITTLRTRKIHPTTIIVCYCKISLSWRIFWDPQQLRKSNGISSALITYENDRKHEFIHEKKCTKHQIQLKTDAKMLQDDICRHTTTFRWKNEKGK